MARAMAEFSGSKMMTKPPKSSLMLEDLHLGHVDP
jgi:hypothetical protein